MVRVQRGLSVSRGMSCAYSQGMPQLQFDATAASHMHNVSDLNYKRGYEWFLLSEAKKRK